MHLKRIVLIVVLLGLMVFAYFAYYVYSVMFIDNTAFNNEEACIFIPTDATYDDVRGYLEPILNDIETFDALAVRKKYVNNIKAGKYCIAKGMNNNEIINTIRSKNIPVRVSFNNQNSLESLAGRISSQIEADSTRLIQAFTDSLFLSKNGLNANTALSIYFPNSYEFFWNTNAEAFRDRMLKEYKRYWTDERLKQAKDIGLTTSEVVTLASIVHEESKQAVEQPRIAGVYMNRLKSGWPLQADPTLKFAAYQLDEYKGEVIKRVLNKHKEIDSPYNTYKNLGLPPGPIGMPDLSAVNAVLNYEDHNYYYFAVDASRPGFHKFAMTLAEHNKNAREYHQYLNQQGIRR